jgi:transcriptional regulator with XRE-family HTH domain
VVHSATKVLGARLSALRREAGLRQAQLAERIDVSTEFVSRMERARTLPSLPTLLALCDALSCTPNDLLAVEPAGGPLAVDLARLVQKLHRVSLGIARDAVGVAESYVDFRRRRPRGRA